MMVAQNPDNPVSFLNSKGVTDRWGGRQHVFIPSLMTLVVHWSIPRDDGMWTVFKRGEEAGWVNKGFDLIKHGKHAEAIECFIKALELNPKDIEGWLGKGIALAHLDQHRQAIECFEYVIRLSPDHGEAWFHRAVSLAKLGKHDQAILCYDKALRQMSRDPWVWYRKGVSLEETGNHREAVDCYDKALTMEEIREIRERRDRLLHRIREMNI